MSRLEVFCAFVTSLLGISYPLLLQAVERVDVKYDARSLVDLLCASKWYIIFKLFLILNIVTLLIVTFGVEFDSIRNIYQQISYWLLLPLIIFLIFSFFMFCDEILKFYRTERIVKRFSTKGERWLTIYKWLFRLQNKNVLDLPNNIVAKQSRWSKCKLKFLGWSEKRAKMMYIHSAGDLEWDAWTGLMKALIRKKGNLLVNSYRTIEERLTYLREMDDRPEVSYPDSINKAVVEINSSICRSSERAFTLIKANDLLSCYCGYTDKKENSDSLRSNIWYCLNEMIYRKRDDLLFSHWRLAIQHFSFHIDDVQKVAYQRKFVEFYLAFGAHLFYMGRDDLLADMMFVAESDPPLYRLMPSNFSELFGWYLEFFKSPYEDNFLYESRYDFLHREESMQTDGVRKWLRKYIALLCLRLKYVIPVYVMIDIKGYNNSFEKSLKCINDYISACNSLLKDVKEVSSAHGKCKILFAQRNYEDKETDILQLVSSYLAYLEQQKKDIEENPVISNEIVDGYKNTIKEVLNERLKVYSAIKGEEKVIPNCSEDIREQIKKGIYKNDACYQCLLPTNYFVEEGENVVGVDDSIVSNIYAQILNHITLSFLCQQIDMKSVYVDDVGKALDILKPNSQKHVILCFGHKEYLINLNFPIKCTYNS